MSHRRGVPALAGEDGLTVIELLVAAAMSVVIVGAASSLLISAVQDQPGLSRKAQAVSSARTVLERMTREIRNGFYVYSGASGSSVSFKTRLRRSTCGGGAPASASAPSIECEVTYECAGATSVTCARTEKTPGASEGRTERIVGELESAEVFNYSPNAEEPTFIGVTLEIPNPEGPGNLTISDGAQLRTLALPE